MVYDISVAGTYPLYCKHLTVLSNSATEARMGCTAASMGGSRSVAGVGVAGVEARGIDCDDLLNRLLGPQFTGVKAEINIGDDVMRPWESLCQGSSDLGSPGRDGQGGQDGQDKAVVSRVDHDHKTPMQHSENGPLIIFLFGASLFHGGVA